MPAMAKHGVTLEVLAELIRQTVNAGVWHTKERATAGSYFESIRDQIVIQATDPWFFKASTIEKLRAEFIEATTAVEEVNRLQGLALTIKQFEQDGQNYLDLTEQIMRDIQTRRPEEGACYAVFPFGSG
jgi:hypothetical protein